MRKFEIDEINCPESYVTVSIRGDLIGTVAKCLRQCNDLRVHWKAVRLLGEQLRIAGDMIYRKTSATDHLELADVVVDHNGSVYEQEDTVSISL